MESSAYYPNLSVGHVFGRAWEVFRDNMGLIFGIVAVQMLVPMVAVVIPILPPIIVGPLQCGAYYAILKIVRDEEVEVKNVFDGFEEFGRTLGVSWAYALIVGVGLMFLFVPGLILGLGLWPALFLVMDEQFGIGDTLQEAWEMTKGHKWSLFAIYLAIAGLMLVGLFAFIIGILFVAVFAYVVGAVVYDELAAGRA